MDSTARLKIRESNARSRLGHCGTVLERRRLPEISGWLCLILVSLLTFGLPGGAFADSTALAEPKFNFDSVRNSVWDTDVGNGFRKHATEVGIAGGVGFGVRIFSTTQYHDLGLGAVHVGTMLSGPIAKDHFWRGNLELIGTLFGGQQFHPHGAYVVGLAPLLRYNFATDTPLVPYVGGGAGVSLTDIRHPDLSTDFEFNLQLGAGVHWFFNPKISATLEGRLLHLSNAGIAEPNNGVNTVLVLAGVNWFF